MTINNELDLLDFEDGAKLLQIGIVTFRKLIDEGKIPFVQISEKLRKVKKQDILDYINNQNKTPATEPKNNDAEILHLEIEIEKSKTEAIVADNKLKLKMAELNIKALEDYQTMRETLLNEQQTLLTERAKVTAEQSLLNGLKNDYSTLLATMNDIIKHQEQVTQDANRTMLEANTKLDNYDRMIEKKCADCLRRDKAKCDKCNFKLYTGMFKKDFEKWSKKHGY